MMAGCSYSDIRKEKDLMIDFKLLRYGNIEVKSLVVKPTIEYFLLWVTSSADLVFP